MDKQLAKGTIVTIPQGLASWMPNAKWIIIFLIACLIADIPLARLDYKMQLESRITTHKKELLRSYLEKPCNLAHLNDGKSGVDCETFCNTTYKLSLERVNVVLTVRSRHHAGAYAADFFDRFRGVEQEKKKTDDLFLERTCHKVLESVDKSNELVNYACYITSLLFLGVCIMVLHKIIEVPAMDRDTLEKTALQNFARYHRLEPDSTTKEMMMSSPVSLHIWASLKLSVTSIKGERSPAAKEVATGVTVKESPKSQQSRDLNQTLPPAQTLPKEAVQPAVTSLPSAQAQEQLRQRPPADRGEQD
jgi:hypothetical protein